MKSILFNFNGRIILGLLLGLLTGYCDMSILNQIADAVSQVFINSLKLISAPIIFLSIFSTVLSMKDVQEFKQIGKHIVKYTLLTTWIAATIGLILLLIINPTHVTHTQSVASLPTDINKGYLYYLIHAVPSNILSPFIENNVLGILFLAILLSAASLTLPDTQRCTLHGIFSSLNALILKTASWIILLIPIAIWAFITHLFKDLKNGLGFQQIALYLLVVVSANLIQGLVVLPLLTKLKGLSPLKLAMNMLPALSMAFFSKSSAATLPLTMHCAEERAKMPKKLTQLAFPLCTAINMNGCAGFILTTVLFVSMSNGVHYSLLEMFGWTFIATIAAVGNAGVPMGCYFLSSAFLIAMNIPLNIMAIILPFYAFLDMLETMFNVWSDVCVTAVVNHELQAENTLDLNPDLVLRN